MKFCCQTLSHYFEIYEKASMYYYWNEWLNRMNEWILMISTWKVTGTSMKWWNDETIQSTSSKYSCDWYDGDGSQLYYYDSLLLIDTRNILSGIFNYYQLFHHFHFKIERLVRFKMRNNFVFNWKTGQSIHCYSVQKRLALCIHWVFGRLCHILGEYVTHF